MTDGCDVPGPDRSRRRFLGIAGGLAMLAVAGGAVASGPATGWGAQRGRLALPRLRVAAFNIHHGADPDDVVDLDRVARLIETLDCDVIGLQEVDRFARRSGYLDQPQWLGERLDRHAVFGRTRDLEPDESGRPRREYGNAILSRWPITTSDNTLLPRFGDHEQRGLLRAVVATPGGDLTVAATHLMHDDNADERIAQTEAIVRELGDSATRTILVGDFNARPDSDPIRLLTTNLIDSWSAVGHGDGHSYPSHDPYKRIDYLFASSDVVPDDMTVVTNDPRASDHLPIRGVFDLAG